MTIELPVAIADYFATDQTGDAAAFLGLFAEDAVVVDERQTYVGRDRIRAWKAAASARYSYTAAPFAIARSGGQTVVTAHLTGDFPGSPVDLRYAFTLDQNLITRLEIAP